MEQKAAIEAMAALAQITRLEAFRLLVKYEPDGLAAGELARLLAVPPNTLSSHLAIMARANLVSSQRRSRSIVYRANLPAFHPVVLFLFHRCAFPWLVGLDITAAYLFIASTSFANPAVAIARSRSNTFYGIRPGD